MNEGSPFAVFVMVAYLEPYARGPLPRRSKRERTKKKKKRLVSDVRQVDFLRVPLFTHPPSVRVFASDAAADAEDVPRVDLVEEGHGLACVHHEQHLPPPPSPSPSSPPPPSSLLLTLMLTQFTLRSTERPCTRKARKRNTQRERERE